MSKLDLLEIIRTIDVCMNDCLEAIEALDESRARIAELLGDDDV